MTNNKNSEKNQAFIKKLCIGAGKILVAGIIAFIFLNIFAGFYYNIPSRENSSSNSTDFERTANDTYFKMTEGFGYGKTDAKGFNNIKVIENPDILILGSSQTEGYNVTTEQNYTALLNDLFKANGYNMQAYNIGVSAHNFGVCLNNLAAAYNEFQPKKYVVIESTDILLSQAAMDKLQAGTYPRDTAGTSGILDFLQKSDYLRLLNLKLNEVQANKAPVANVVIDEWDEKYLDSLDAILKKAANQVGDCKLIIISSEPTTLVNSKIQEKSNPDKYNIFKEVCMKNNILFIDTYEDFKLLYTEKRLFPSGFSNTHVGKGHMNKHGHKILAEKLYTAITETEDKI